MAVIAARSLALVVAADGSGASNVAAASNISSGSCFRAAAGHAAELGPRPRSFAAAGGQGWRRRYAPPRPPWSVPERPMPVLR